MKMKKNYQNVWNEVKVLKGKFIAWNAYIRKENTSENNNILYVN